MNRDQIDPPFILDEIDLDKMTLREVGDVAEAQGMTLLDVLTS